MNNAERAPPPSGTPLPPPADQTLRCGSQNGLWQWASACYAGMHGSLRFKIYFDSSNATFRSRAGYVPYGVWTQDSPVTGEPNVSFITADPWATTTNWPNRNWNAGGASGFFEEGFMNGLVENSNYQTTDPLTRRAQALPVASNFNNDKTGYHAIEVPYVSPYLYLRTQPYFYSGPVENGRGPTSDASTTGIIGENCAGTVVLSARLISTSWSVGVKNTWSVAVHMAAGDEFRFGIYLGPPRIDLRRNIYPTCVAEI